MKELGLSIDIEVRAASIGPPTIVEATELIAAVSV